MVAQPKLVEEEHFSTPETLRSEVNLLTLPFFALSRKELVNKDQTVYQNSIERNGKRVDVLWKVSRSINFPYPGPFDRHVHKAIEEILNRQALPIKNPIPFTIYQICKHMGITKEGGKNYRKIREALRTMVATTIESKGTFYSKGQKTWVDDIFHLYDRIVFRGEQLPNGQTADTNYLFLGSWYLDSFNNRYVRPLDYQYYKSLQRLIAQRLYELLGVKFYRVLQSNGPYLNYRYSTLCQLLPVKRQKHFSQVKQQMQPAFEELISTGFLEEAEWQDVEDVRDWMVYFYPGDRAIAEITSFKVPENEPILNTEQEQLGLPLPGSGDKDEVEVLSLVQEMLHVLGDEKSKKFYTKVARLIPHYTIYRFLAEVKDEWHRNQIRTTRGAVFTVKIKQYCKENGINLGLKSGEN